MVRISLSLALLLSISLAHAAAHEKAAAPAEQKAPAKAAADQKEKPAKEEPKHVDSKHIKHITTAAEFKKHVESGKPFVAEFFADYCGACGMQAPLFSQIADALHEKATFATLDMTKGEVEKIAATLQVGAIPTIIIVNKGKRVQTIRGGHPTNALNFLKGLISAGIQKTEEEKIEAPKDEPKQEEKKQDEKKK